MLSNILLSATSLVTAPIFTRLLTPSDYGIASNFVAWQTIGLVVIGLGLPYSIGNAETDFSADLDSYIASIQTLCSATALIALIGAAIFRRQLSAWMEMDESLIIVLFVYLLFLPSVTYAQEKYRFQLKFRENILISVVNTFGSIASCLVLITIVFHDKRYLGRIIGLILPMCLMGLFFYVKIIRDGWSLDIGKYWTYATKISLPMVPHALAMTVLTQIDRIMIIKMCGKSEAGLYSFGFSYAVLMSIVSNAVSKAYQPWLYINYSNNSLEAIRTSSNIITSVICLLTLAQVVTAPEAIRVLGARSFWDARLVVMPIAIGALFQYLASMYSMLELYHKRTAITAVGTVLAATVNYCLNRIFIPNYGYLAASYATLVGFLVLAIFHLIAYGKVTRMRVYDDAYIWTILIVTTVASAMSLLLYDSLILRYSLLVTVALIVMVSQKKRIITVCRSLSGIE